ncbi:hypothetical protein ACFOUP_05005 [Belliella kenyensis]|uniref:TolB-like 6-blade propeller-like n=1 Tax=Belliella kenyensis TaxID=1472724 RepID=A0ABV8EI21_9BACT|nr:hypothetical protein [Belliella kenyensis]MCH7402652.1 hypothetical protein [Belliella kenyensis]MDN3603800.1 hypothetical protein [Belliella kenyensis]
MNYTTMSTRFYPILIILIAFGCIEKINKEEPSLSSRTEWAKVDDIATSIYSVSQQGGNINLLSGDHLYYNYNFKGSESKTFNYTAHQTRPGWFRLPISENFLVTRTEIEINVFAINPNGVSAPLTINPKTLDDTFVRFEDTAYWSGYGAFGLTETGNVLIPYRTIRNGLAENNPSFLLISLAKENNAIVIKETKVIKPNVISYYDSVNVLFANDDFFLVRVGNRIVSIDTRGNYRVEANADGAKFVKLADRIVGVGYSNNSKETSIFEMNLDGSNFMTKVKTVVKENLLSYNYTAVDNRIIAFLDDKIFELTNINNKPDLRELNNSKLEDTFISAIFVTNDQKITITTHCRTLCGGIYEKDLDKFFEFKNTNN